jgi:hypothetical protein
MSEFRDIVVERVNAAMESVTGERTWTSDECLMLTLIVDDIVLNFDVYHAAYKRK